jgi:hypothetical protein
MGSFLANYAFCTNKDFCSQTTHFSKTQFLARKLRNFHKQGFLRHFTYIFKAKKHTFPLGFPVKK